MVDIRFESVTTGPKRIDTSANGPVAPDRGSFDDHLSAARYDSASRSRKQNDGPPAQPATTPPVTPNAENQKPAEASIHKEESPRAGEDTPHDSKEQRTHGAPSEGEGAAHAPAKEEPRTDQDDLVLASLIAADSAATQNAQLQKQGRKVEKSQDKVTPPSQAAHKSKIKGAETAQPTAADRGSTRQTEVPSKDVTAAASQKKSDALVNPASDEKEQGKTSGRRTTALNTNVEARTAAKSAVESDSTSKLSHTTAATSGSPAQQEEKPPASGPSKPRRAMANADAPRHEAAAARSIAAAPMADDTVHGLGELATKAASRHRQSSEESPEISKPTDATPGEGRVRPAETQMQTPNHAVSGGLRHDGAASSPRPADHATRSNAVEVDRARFVERVARAMHRGAERGGTMQLRLSPPELGSVKLEITMKDGVMSAHLEAENPNARAALLDNLPALRERLADQQIRLERFDVDLRRDERDGSPQLPNPQQGHQGQQNRESPQKELGLSPRAGSTDVSAMAIRRSAQLPGQLNVIV